MKKTISESIAIWVITPGGLSHALKLRGTLPESTLFVSASLISDDMAQGTKSLEPDPGDIIQNPCPSNPCSSNPCSSNPCPSNIMNRQDCTVFPRLSRAIELHFRHFKGHIFIFSTGIAVRIIAPLLQSKLHDPAVVVMDDRAHHAVSLISGHLGGGNELTLRVSRITGASPVITTATDVHGLPSIDTIAKCLGLAIENPEMIKKVNMVFLRGGQLNIMDPLNLVSARIPGKFIVEQNTPLPGTTGVPDTSSEPGELQPTQYVDLPGTNGVPNTSSGTWVYCGDMEIMVPRETLILRPPSLVVGMGCNRDTPAMELMELMVSSFKDKGLSMNSIAAIATTLVKENEKGLLQLAENLGKTILFYDRDELNSVKNIENPSDMVEKHIGVKSVCEAAAILGAHNGKLIVPKIKKGNATLAVARIEADSLLSEQAREALIICQKERWT
ncbi:MAG: cobalt-precorrin 5A hydrolase [Desulfamplus sp.]|nr:cobalt-precorrin 5A hydrolase [Desulfamplus sp.]